MIINKDGEISDITEEDFKRAIKNPYAEKIHRAGTVVIDEEILDFFKKLAKEKGVYHGQLISDTLKEYITSSEHLQQ